MNNIFCTIDTREKERIPYAKQFFNTYMPITNELNTGDFMFVNGDNGEFVVFEYKTMKDFLGSVTDGRIWEQVQRMNEFDWSFIVIEGTIENLQLENRRRMFQKNKGRPFSLAQFYGVIARLNCYTTVVQCHNQAEAFHYMESQMLKIFDDAPLVKHFKHDSVNPVLNFLCCINGINYKTASLIVNEGGINSLVDLIYALEYRDLTEIDGIGKVTVEKIRKNVIGV